MLVWQLVLWLVFALTLVFSDGPCDASGARTLLDGTPYSSSHCCFAAFAPFAACFSNGHNLFSSALHLGRSAFRSIDTFVCSSDHGLCFSLGLSRASLFLLLPFQLSFNRKTTSLTTQKHCEQELSIKNYMNI